MLKEKKRYLKIKFIHSKKLNSEDAKHCIYEAVFSLLGENGASNAMVQLKEFSIEDQIAIVKCRTEFLEDAISALALKNSFKGLPVSLQLEKISGNIGKLL